jgi:hypothetical protein
MVKEEGLSSPPARPGVRALEPGELVDDLQVLDPHRASRALGMVPTTWTFRHKFAGAYGQVATGPGMQQVACFKAVMSRPR